MSLTKERDGMEVHTPEIDKLMQIPREVQEKIQGFIDWLYDEQKWEIAEFDSEEEQYYPVFYTREQIMGFFFDIDPWKIDQEKNEMIEAIRRKREEDNA